jgi:hypothetical protein
MHEAKTAAELLDLIRVERLALEESMAELSDEELSTPGVAGHWSAKDILTHVTWWESQTLKKLRGERTAHDRLGGEDNDAVIDIVNNEVYLEYREQPAAEVRSVFRSNLARVTGTLAIYEEDFVRANLNFIAENTYRHYPEHAAQIREWAAREPARA